MREEGLEEKQSPTVPFFGMWGILWMVLLLLLMSACGQVEPGQETVVGELDHDVFKADIQAILDNRKCSDGTCHIRDKNDPFAGGPGGSLRLYECTAALCTAEQLQANHDSAAGMANLVNPADSRLLTKPLAESISGVQHLGDNIFLSTADPDYLTLLSWIQSPL